MLLKKISRQGVNRGHIHTRFLKVLKIIPQELMQVLQGPHHGGVPPCQGLSHLSSSPILLPAPGSPAPAAAVWLWDTEKLRLKGGELSIQPGEALCEKNSWCTGKNVYQSSWKSPDVAAGYLEHTRQQYISNYFEIHSTWFILLQLFKYNYEGEGRGTEPCWEVTFVI